jgi:hypothetical protein
VKRAVSLLMLGHYLEREAQGPLGAEREYLG